MAIDTFRDITRDYYRSGVNMMDLEIFMREKDITFHRRVNLYLLDRPTLDIKVRVLTKDMFSGIAFNIGENSGHTKTVTASSVKFHALDEKCIVFPSLIDYVGAYRFIPSDDIPTFISSRMAYLRCPNILTAVSLSLWLRHPRVVAAIRHEFKKKRGRNSKEMNFDFLGVIPVPDGMLQPHIVGRALEIDNEIVVLHKRLNALSDELGEMSVQYR